MMNRSDERFVKNWSYTRKMGRFRYALTHGFVFGLILFLFTGLYGLWEKSFSEVFLSLRSGLVFLFWVAGGVVAYGTTFWPINEYLYKKKMSDQQAEQP
ncbi:MAG: hypothetical protein ACK4VN_02480 [Bacteroidales bacterium]